MYRCHKRKDFWDIYTHGRKKYFADILAKEVYEFVALMAEQTGKEPVGRYMSDMTAGKFYEFCKTWV